MKLLSFVVYLAVTVERMKQLEQQLMVERQQHHEVVEHSEVLERHLADCKQTVASLQEEIKAKDHILAEVRMSVVDREQQLEMQREECEAKQLAAVQTSVDLEAANQTIQMLEVEITNRDTLLQNVHRDIEHKEQKLSEVTASSSESRQLVSDMECKLSAQGTEMEMLRGELNTRCQELQQVRAETEKLCEAGVTVDAFQQLQDQNAALQSSVTELKGEVSNLTASLYQSETENQQLQSSLHLTSSSSTEQKAAISSLEAQLTEIGTQSQEEILLWKEKVSTISDQLSSCMVELERLKESERITAEEKEALQSALSGKDDKLRTLSLQLEASEENVHQVRMELEAAASAHQVTIGKLHTQSEQTEVRVKEMEELMQGKDVLISDMKAELENVRRQLEDVTQYEAERQQMFVDREMLLSNTIATLHQQLQESAARVEALSTKCKEQDDEVDALMKKLDDRDTKIASLSENFKEEEMQLVALTEELEACRARAAEDKVSAEAEWQKIVDSKDAEVATLVENADKQETKMKKYVAVIKQLKKQLEEEKVKREALEKHSSSSVDDSFLSADEKPAEVSEPDRPVDHVIPLQQPMTNTIAASCETPYSQTSDAESIKAAAEQQISELKQINQQLQLEISKLESKSSEYETTVTHLNAVVSRLKTDNETLQGDVENMSVEMRQASAVSCAQIQELSAELDHWKSKTTNVEQMREDMARLDSERLNDIGKVESMMSEMAVLRNELDARSDDIKLLNTRLSDEVAEKECVKRELDVCKETHAQLQIEYSNVTADRTRLEQELAVSYDTFQQLSDDNTQLRTNCESLSEELQLRRSEAEAARLVETTDKLRAECEEKEAVMKDMQLEVEKLRKASADGNWKSMEEYSILEYENSRLTEQCNSLIKRLEEDQNKYEAFVKSAAEKGHLAEENERLLGKLKAAEEKDASLEQRLKEVEIDYAKNFNSFKQIQNKLESEKTRLEMEVERLKDTVMKSEGTIQQLVADLGAEREEFSLRESELEGSSEELQLEVARLAQQVETDSEEAESLRSRNMEIEMHLNSLASEKDSVEIERNEYYEYCTKLVEEYELLKTECEELRQVKEQLVGEFHSDQHMAERKYAALSDQYDMLSTDISNYQELVESLHAKNFHLEQQLQKSFADDSSQMAVNRELEMERERMEDERRLHGEEVRSLQGRESTLLGEIKRLQLQLEEYSNTEEELLKSQSRVVALQTENDSLQKSIGELEQRVQELAVIEAEQSVVQERYLALLQDNNALIRQSKEMYEKLRSFKEMAESSGSPGAVEVATLKAEVELLQSECESAMQKGHECEQLRAELVALKAFTQQQTSELQALQASASQQSSSHKPKSPETMHRESLAKTAAERQPELMLNEEAARVHVVPVHSSSSPPKVTSDDRLLSEINRLKAQVTTLPEQL